MNHTVNNTTKNIIVVEIDLQIINIAGDHQNHFASNAQYVSKEIGQILVGCHGLYRYFSSEY
jgi:hypothetical protein